MRTHRAQISLIALAATVILIIAMLYMTSQSREVDRQVRQDHQKATETRDEFIDVQAIITGVLDESFADAIIEVGGHGGFPVGMSPNLSVNGVPYLFYRGKIINIPTDSVVEQMLARRLEVLMGNALSAQKLHERIEVGEPTVNTQIALEEISVEVTVPSSVRTDETVAQNTITITRTYSLRLGLLLQTARSFIANYDRNRTMEGTLLTGIINDERIPSPPGLVAGTVPCSTRTVLRERDQLIEPVRDNVRLAVARTMVLANDALNHSSLEWDHSMTVLAVNFTMLANKGVEGYESKKIIHLVPTSMPLVDVASDKCMGRYTVSYAIDFPLRLVIRDIHKAYRVIGGSGTDVSRTLELIFYMRPLLVGEDTEAREDHGQPSEIDDPCTGPCSLDLSIDGSRTGTVSVDACSYPYSDGLLRADNVPCGIHTVIVGSTDPTGLPRVTLERNIRDTLTEIVKIEAFGKSVGRVYLNSTVLCTNEGRLEERARKPLGYVEGAVDQYVELLFAPLGPGPLLRAIVDEEGYYILERAEPGRYIRVTRPSLDGSGTPTYMAQVDVSLVDITPGDNTGKDVILQPLVMERVDDLYVPVSLREEC